MASPPTTQAPPASRNSPCPCGSGRRYKDCHGRVEEAAPAPAADDVARRLRAALAAQQSGRVADAIAAYDEVIAVRPDLFDAWHMRGVARFQRLEFDLAERDIRRALEIAPGLEAARGNLALVVQGRRIAEDEVALCREVLPRYAPHAVDPPVAPLDGAAAGERVFVLDAADATVTADALAREAASRGASVVRMAVVRGRAIGGDDAARLASCGARDFVACVGTGRPLGDWTLEARPRAMALVAVDGGLPSFIDRLREASGQGRRRCAALMLGSGLDLAPIPHATMPP